MPDRMSRAADEGKSRRSRLLWVGLPVFTVFAVFGIIVWLAYQENARVPDGEPPLIRAIARPYKQAPDDPGGRQIADQGEINDLLRDEPAPIEPERVLPLPEEPRRPIVVQREAAQETPDGPAPSPAVADTTGDTLPSEAQSTRGAGDATKEAEAALARLLTDVGPAASSADQQASSKEAVDQPAVKEPATHPAPTVPTLRPEQPPSTHAPTIVRNETPKVAAPVDAPSKEADEALTRLLAEVAGVPSSSSEGAAPPRAVAAIAPANPPVPQRAMGPGFRVQLAAVREQDDVRRAWNDLAGRLGSVVADYEPFYERAETSNGVFYRIQLGPFASEQSADRLCNEVQRRNASCFVVAR